MKLPPLSHPERYVGLYVYDFKTHVSVGYTGVEIRYLRESAEFREGTAYEIYRVTEEGGLELRGTLDQGPGFSQISARTRLRIRYITLTFSRGLQGHL